MIKKAFAVFLSFALMVSLFVGCGKRSIDFDSDTENNPLENLEEPTSKSAKKPYRVTFYTGAATENNDVLKHGGGTAENGDLSDEPKSGEDIPDADEPGGSPVNKTQDEENSSETTTKSKSISDSKKKSDDQDEIAKVDAVGKHESATPPTPSVEPGQVFIKWDTDFTDIKKDTEVHAVIADVSEEPNVIASQGAYGRQGEMVIVPITLCGNVKLAGIDMTITYDTDSLLLESVFNEDGAVIYNTDTPGEVHLNYVSTGNTMADVDLCSLKFSVKAAEGEHAVRTTINSVYALNGSTLYSPEYTIVDANVYVFE